MCVMCVSRVCHPNSTDIEKSLKSAMFRRSFAIVALGLLVFSSPPSTRAQNDGRNLLPPRYQTLARDIFKELIEINTSLNVGSTKAAEAMAARLRSAGFAESDIHLVGPHPDHMNLVFRLRGNGASRPILAIGHLDVVDALRGDWSVDPFRFVDSGGYFYGRGSTDMKCEDAELIANVIRFKEERFVPDRDIIVALTEDEENGNYNGVQWLIRNQRQLIDAEYCINPDAGGGSIKKGKHTVMEMQTSEKIYIDYQFEARNKGGHSSQPVKNNAIYRLAAALERLAAYDFPIQINETTRNYFERTASRETGQTADDMRAVARIPMDTAAALRLAASSPYYNALLRTTCVATMLSGGHAENALPQTARANINCRMLPDDTPDHVLATLRSVVADTGVTVSCVYTSALGPRSPIRQDVLGAVESTTEALWPGVVVTPVMGTGASDGKYLRLAGIPTYGVSGMFGDIDDVRAHGRDERLGVAEFYEGVEFMYRFLKIVTTSR